MSYTFLSDGQSSWVRITKTSSLCHLREEFFQRLQRHRYKLEMGGAKISIYS